MQCHHIIPPRWGCEIRAEKIWKMKKMQKNAEKVVLY